MPRAHSCVAEKRGSFVAQIGQISPEFEAFYREQGVIIDQEDATRLRTTANIELPLCFRILQGTAYSESLVTTVEIYRQKWESKNMGGGPCPISRVDWLPGTVAYSIRGSRATIRADSILRHLKEFINDQNEGGSLVRQEAVSMIPPLMLDMESMSPKGAVLDLCCAPGSKTSQLLEFVQARNWEEAIVVGNDLDHKRLHMVTSRLRHLMTKGSVFTNHAAQDFPTMRNAEGEILRFDRIVADVPCSGDGTMRKNKIRWSPVSGNELHSVQQKILWRGLELLKIGGRLVYSTCSLNPIENEAVVLAVLRRANGAVRVVPEALIGLREKCILRPGLRSWKVPTVGTTLADKWEGFTKHRPTGSYPVSASMFSNDSDPKLSEDVVLGSARIIPHDNDSGGFYIIALEKTAEFPEIEDTEVTKRELKSTSDMFSLWNFVGPKPRLCVSDPFPSQQTDWSAGHQYILRQIQKDVMEPFYGNLSLSEKDDLLRTFVTRAESVRREFRPMLPHEREEVTPCMTSHDIRLLRHRKKKEAKETEQQEPKTWKKIHLVNQAVSKYFIHGRSESVIRIIRCGISIFTKAREGHVARISSAGADALWDVTPNRLILSREEFVMVLRPTKAEGAAKTCPYSGTLRTYRHHRNYFELDEIPATLVKKMEDAIKLETAALLVRVNIGGGMWAFPVHMGKNTIEVLVETQARSALLYAMNR